MDELYKIQNVTYNATGGTLKNDKAVIDLTAQQNRLLRYLVLNAGQTLTKEQITAHVWGYDVDSDVSNLIYDTVSAVRRLLKTPVPAQGTVHSPHLDMPLLLSAPKCRKRPAKDRVKPRCGKTPCGSCLARISVRKVFCRLQVHDREF